MRGRQRSNIKQIGGSEIGAIVGSSPFCGPWDVWAAKKNPDDQENIKLDIGKQLERIVRRRAEKILEKRITPNGRTFFPKSRPWACATPDGFLKSPRERAIVEIKTISPHIKKFWRYGPPEYVEDQVQWYMGLLHYDNGIVASYCLGDQDVEIQHISFDKERFDFLDMKAKAFFTRYIKGGETPPLDGSKAASDYLEALYPEETEGKIIEDESVTEAVGKLFEIKKKIACLQEEKREIENEVKHILGDAEGARGPGYFLSWKRVKDRVLFSKNDFLEKAPALLGIERERLEEVVLETSRISKGGRRFSLLAIDEEEGIYDESDY